jgi:hypothetical protein
LQDDKSLEDYGITNGATILVLKKFAAIGSEPSVSGTVSHFILFQWSVSY